MGGGADELGAVSMRAVVGGGEVASSTSSITLAFTVAAEEEYSVLKRWSSTQGSSPWRSGVELESFIEAIVLKISFSTKQGQTLPRPPTGFMSNKGILGGKIANAIDIHQEALHLSLEPEMMLILFLMKGHKKFSVIENARTLPRPLCNGAFSGFSEGTMRCTCSTNQRINTSDCFNSFNVLRETLMLRILKSKRLLGRLRINGFNGHIHIRQKDPMIASRGLISDN